jgi:hypothetical protein
MVELAIPTSSLKLTPRQQSFIKAYTTLGSETYRNGAASVRFSGYNAKNPSNTACKILSDPTISNLVEELDRAQWDWTLEKWTQEVVKSGSEVASTHANKPRYLEMIAKSKGFIKESSTNNSLFVIGSEDIMKIRQAVAGLSDVGSKAIDVTQIKAIG